MISVEKFEGIIRNDQNDEYKNRRRNDKKKKKIKTMARKIPNRKLKIY